MFCTRFDCVKTGDQIRENRLATTNFDSWNLVLANLTLITIQYNTQCAKSSVTLPQTSVMVSLWNIGRDEKIFHRPLDFMPERWQSDMQPREQKLYRSLPFGHGRRMCVGRRLAETEIHLLLIKVSGALVGLCGCLTSAKLSDRFSSDSTSSTPTRAPS